MSHSLVIPILLGVFLAFCFGTSDYLSKSVIEQVGPYRTAVYTLTVSGICVLAPALILKSTFDVSPFLVLALATISISTFSAFVFMYRAYGGGVLSLVSPLVNSYPAFSVGVSLLLLGVVLPPGAVVALAVVIVGICLVSTRFSDLRNRLSSRSSKLTPGVGSALTAALFFAIAWTSMGFANEYLGYLLPAIFVRSVAAVMGFAAAPILGQRVNLVRGKLLPRVLVMGVLEAAGIVSFSLGVSFSTTTGAVPILTTFTGVGVAFTVVYAIVLLKEKLEMNHVIGIALLISGIAVLLYLTS